MSMSKRLRFNVFKRDDFQCQYCGRRSPDVILEVDHIVPRKEGGGDDIENLVTSCFECNRGKGSDPLSKKKMHRDIRKDLKLQKEREEQLREYYKHKKKIDSIKEKAIDRVEIVMFEHEGKKEFTSKGRASIKQFLTNGFTAEDIISAWYISIDKLPYRSWDNQFRYMCGILHNWRRKKDEGDL